MIQGNVATHSLLLVKNLQVPTMQFDSQQSGQRFRCVILAVNNVASSRDMKRATEVWRAHSSLTSHFQICSSFKLVVFSQRWCWLRWHHLRTFIRLHTAPSGNTEGFIYAVVAYCLADSVWRINQWSSTSIYHILQSKTRSKLTIIGRRYIFIDCSAS